LFTNPSSVVHGLWYHYRGRAFDLWHGIETGKGGVQVPYDPTEPKYIRWAFRNLPEPADGFSFVDFGSGKGRVLVAAARYPFLQAVGVERSSELHQAALANLRSARGLKCTSVTSICMDAADYSVPNTPCVLFFYNPFRGETMNRVLSNIAASLARWPRPVFIIYVNPILHDLFLGQPGLRLLRSGNWCNLYQWGPLE
jgi:SAM-dependent methyltransferase